jgi:hypothetical protein
MSSLWLGGFRANPLASGLSSTSSNVVPGDNPCMRLSLPCGAGLLSFREGRRYDSSVGPPESLLCEPGPPSESSEKAFFFWRTSPQNFSEAGRIFFRGAERQGVADSGRANGSRPPSSRKGEALSGIVQIEAPIFSRFAWPGGQSAGRVCLGHKRQASSPVELAGAAACGTRRSIERRISRPALPSEERCSKACQAPGLEERRHAFAAGHACSEFAASPSCPSPWRAHAPARTQHRDFAA